MIMNIRKKNQAIIHYIKKARRGRSYLLKEEKPLDAYKTLREASTSGFDCLILSKLHLERIRSRYNIRKGMFYRLTCKRSTGTLNLKKLSQIRRATNKFARSSRKAVILLDGFDQIMFGNGFESSITLLSDLKELCSDKNANFLVSINPQWFNETQLTDIEMILNGKLDYCRYYRPRRFRERRLIV